MPSVISHYQRRLDLPLIRVLATQMLTVELMKESETMT